MAFAMAFGKLIDAGFRPGVGGKTSVCGVCDGCGELIDVDVCPGVGRKTSVCGVRNGLWQAD